MNQDRIDTLRQLVQMNSEDTFSHYALALEHLEEEPKTARDMFRELLSRSPDYVAAYFQLGRACQALGDLQAAREAYQSGLPVAAAQNDWHTHGELEDALSELE